MNRMAALAPIGIVALVSAPASYLVGFVQDTNCAPLPGVQISVGEMNAAPVVTDSQGRFIIGVPEGRQRADLSARLEGFRELTRSHIRVGPGARDSHTLTLDVAGLAFSDPIITTGSEPQVVTEAGSGKREAARGKDDRLRGEVLTTACTPVQDAQLSVTGMGAERRARSDAAGRFAFSQLAHGSYRLEVRALGYIPLVRRGTKVDDDTRPVRLLLERGDDGETDTMTDGSNRTAR
jgi:hypothetical protein